MRGRVGRRRLKLTAKQIAIGRALYASRQHTVAEICEQLRCSPATFYRSFYQSDRTVSRTESPGLPAGTTE